jgi:hypothetical protein
LANNQRRARLSLLRSCTYRYRSHDEVDNDIIESLRNETPLTNPKFFKNMTLSMVRNRGNVSQEDLEHFTLQGYGGNKY